MRSCPTLAGGGPHPNKCPQQLYGHELLQCLVNVLDDRADLLRLNESLLEPDGFLPLRARAGIRLKCRASPFGTGSSRRRADIANESASAGGGGTAVPPGSNLRLPKGMSRLRALDKALSGSGSWPEHKVNGKADAASATAGAPATDGGAGEDDDDDEDDHPPPLLDVLVPKENKRQQNTAAAAPPVFTPRRQSAGSSMPWGSASPWSSGASAPRQEPRWLSRFGSGGGGSVASPTNSASGAAGGAQAGGKKKAGAGAGDLSGAMSPRTSVMHFPPPPQSLLPVFDRALHGFDASAPENERWGELPFLVVESWGGIDEAEAPPGEDFLLGGGGMRLRSLT